MISRVAIRLRWLRRKIGRSHLAAHLLGKELPKGHAEQPGLIMIQIDGLSRTQMERAVRTRKLPFLSRLIQRRHFSLETFYSGIPSTTPAVQAEIFYGVRSAVPSFQFFHRQTGQICWMFQPSAATEIENGLKEQSTGLLEGGRSYSNIYRAGATHSHFCSADFALKEILRSLHPVKILLLAILYFPKILRIICLALLEFGLAIIDLFKGLFERKDFLKELQFVFARLFVSIGMREIIRFNVMLDIESGIRVIHANFLGYDEQSHRRGPDSAFAHWTLKGIDRAVRDIYRAAHRTGYRDYELIVFSDHGQERTVSFSSRNERNLTEALEEVFASGSLAGTEIKKGGASELLGNATEWRRSIPKDHDIDKQIVVTALGPVGHIYLPHKISRTEMVAYAKDLVATGGIPLVILPPASNNELQVFNASGEWLLPRDRAEVLGAEHPLLDDVAQDMLGLSKNPLAGDFIISCWDPLQPPMSFRKEHGSHGGPGSEETRGFILLPDRIRRWNIDHMPSTRQRVRGEELRQIALHFLGKDCDNKKPAVPQRIPCTLQETLHLRVMTYNIHSCCGVDGKIRPERISRVINDYDPDIVAVQEVDVNRLRSGSCDQAKIVAAQLNMKHVFHAILKQKDEHYGIAVFAKYPFELVKSGLLSTAVRSREARGAMWLKITPEGRSPIHVFNTHFGLHRRERHAQVTELMGENWLGGVPADEAVILCGDFNSGPRSAVFRHIQSRLRDVHSISDKHKARPGFPSIKPLLRLDHIFVSPHFNVRQIEIPNTLTSTLASDHLPLFAELTQ